MYQTLLYKTLNECFERSNIVPVIVVCPEIANSSLGPNLLARASLDSVSAKIYKLFLAAAADDNHQNTTLQFTPSLSIVSFRNLNASELATLSAPVMEVVQTLTTATPYFCRSLQTLHLCGIPDRICQMFGGTFTALRSFSWRTYPGTYNNSPHGISNLASFANLSVVDLKFGGAFNAVFFGYLGDLEKCQRLSSFTLEIEVANEFDSKAFQNEFCGRFLKENQKLRKLQMINWTPMTEADWKIFGNTRMINLQELGTIPASCFDVVDANSQEEESSSFQNLLRLECTGSSESLANAGNRCLQLEQLTINLGGADSCDGSFLRLALPSAFNNVRRLTLNNLTNLNEDKIGTGFSRLHSLEELSVVKVSSNFTGECLRHIPNPQLLRKLEFVESSLTNNAVRNAIVKFMELKSLNLVHCRGITSMTSQAAEAAAEEEGSFELLKLLTKLEMLTVVGCTGLAASPGAMADVCSSLPNLTSLDCSMSADLPYALIVSFLEKCPQIKKVRFCSRMYMFHDPFLALLLQKFPEKDLSGHVDAGSRQK